MCMYKMFLLITVLDLGAGRSSLLVPVPRMLVALGTVLSTKKEREKTNKKQSPCDHKKILVSCLNSVEIQ